MADEAYLSTIWYRVAGLKPRLRAHVTVHRHRYRGQPWYVLHDLAAGRIHRFTPAAYMLIGQFDGRNTVDEVWQAIAAEQDEHAPSQDEVIRLLSRLHQNDLIQYERSPDVTDLLERYNRQSRQVIKQNLTNPVMFRVPLFDPDRLLERTLPFVRPLTGWFGLVLWAVVMVAALVTAALNWDRLTHNLTDQLLSVTNLAIMAVSYPLLKALHEFGHGWLTKARGGEIREFGIMFLVFFPVPYVDASAASAFRSKWDRAAVAAGGIFVETFVAAVALIVWAQAEAGWVTALAYNLVIIGGVSTLLVNGNPLLKFDGYYVMADLIESPNFGTRANNYYGHIIQRYLFGARHLKEEVATPGERAWFLVYAPAAFVYRIIIMLGIALYVSAHAFVLGVLIAAWSLFNALVKPAFKQLRHVLTSPKLRRVRRRAAGMTFGAIAVLVAALMFVPLPLRTTTEGVVWLPDAAHLRARTDGFVAEVAVARGALVDADTLLVRLEEPTLSARIAALEWRAEEMRRRMLALQVTDRAGAEVAALQLAEAEAELARERARATRLSLRAPVTGRFEPALPPADMAGRWLEEGALLGHVLPPRPEHLRIAVRQDDVALVRGRTRAVEVRLAGRLHEAHPAAVLREVPSALNTLPSAALGAGSGGPFLTDPTDAEGLRSLREVFVYDLTLPEALADAPYGTRVHVRFDHGTEPAAAQLYRRLRQLFLRHFHA